VTGSGEAGVPRVLLLTHPDMERHAAPGHPERQERVDAVVAGVLHGAAMVGAEVEQRIPQPAAEDAILAVHDRDFVAALDVLDESGGAWVDQDTYVATGSMRAARLAAGAAEEAALAVAEGRVEVAFAAVRPPGHHAGTGRAGGFCLLNNIAIAVTALERRRLARRIAIVDWDVHHGDGTQEVFNHHPEVLYASSHQRPLFPGTGDARERGLGEAEGTMHNATLLPGTTDAKFVSTWTNELLPEVEAFYPDAILVSAGYDAHRDDPLAHLQLTDLGYHGVAVALGALSMRLGLPGVAIVLEGGYDLDALRASAAATVTGILEGRRG
jgi:acetoin utilization deacetylase AcuC-like enzyme